MNNKRKLGIYLYIDNNSFLNKSLESIAKIDDLSVCHCVLIDPSQESENSDIYTPYVEKYHWEVLKQRNISKSEAYERLLQESEEEYLNFTCASSVYGDDCLNSILAQINNGHEAFIVMHTKYFEIESELGTLKTKNKSYNFNEKLIYLPLFLNRYFIRNDIAKQYHFIADFEDESLSLYMLQCLRHQHAFTSKKDAVLYYNASQERNKKTFVYQMKKWWYLDEVAYVLDSLNLDVLKDDSMKNLYMYFLQLRFYNNMNNRYTYALKENELQEFFKLASEYLQFFDDQFIINSCPNILLQKFMGLQLLRIKYKDKDLYADFRKNENGEMCAYVKDGIYAKLDEFLISKRIKKDRDGNVNKIGMLFFNYLLNPNTTSVTMKIRGNFEEIPLNNEPGIMKCFNKPVRENYEIILSGINNASFFLNIDGKSYPLKIKYAKKKILSYWKKKIKGSWLCPYFQKARYLDFIIYYTFYKVFTKEKSKQVLMLSDSRASLSGNLAFLDDELKKGDYQINYFFKKSLKEKKSNEEKRYICKQIAESKYVVIDDFYPIIYALHLRKSTRLIQIWHAMGAFKTVGFSRLGKPGGPNPRSITHKNYTDAITSSESIRKNYAEAFSMDIKNVHATGIPRTDIFFDESYKKSTIERIYMKYPQLKDKKVVMFAPTFRGNGQNSAYYDFDWLDFKQLRESLQNEYVFVLKLHPFIKNTEVLPPDDDFFINLTHEREINDLLFVTDILITDYSSVIFEASLLNIQTIFYVPDLEEYIASRDFYYPFETYTFGDVTKNTNELIESIKHGKNDIKRLDEFKEFFCGACDGNATKRAVEQLFDRW